MLRFLENGLRFSLCAAMAAFVLATGVYAAEYQTAARTNVRTEPSTTAAVITTLNSKSHLNMLVYDANSWSKVDINGNEGYIRSDLITVIDVPANSGAGQYTTTSRVNFRSAPSLSSTVYSTLKVGTSVTVTNQQSDGWSAVTYNGKNGYVNSEYLTPASSPEPAATNPPSKQEDGGTSEGEPEGDVQETDAVTYYRTTGRINFRTSASLNASIIATLPTGTLLTFIEHAEGGWTKLDYNGKVGYMKSEYLVLAAKPEGGAAVNNVEYIQWSVVKNGLLPLNVPLQITDVRTGIVYWVQSFSNGSHADVEPKTAADTALLKQTYGGAWSWNPRPVWVTVNGRTFVGSINGMPHGGGVIGGNNMDGQVCIHMPGSTTHNGNASFTRLHQAATEEAWQAAQKK